MPSALQLFVFFVAVMLFAAGFFTVVYKTMPKSQTKVAKPAVKPVREEDVAVVHGRTSTAH
jgi:hypothetical protein